MYIYIYIHKLKLQSKQRTEGDLGNDLHQGFKLGSEAGVSPTGRSSHQSQGAKSPWFFALKNGKNTWWILDDFVDFSVSKIDLQISDYWDPWKKKVPGNGVNLPLFGQDFVHLWSATCVVEIAAFSTIGSRLRSQSRQKRNHCKVYESVASFWRPLWHYQVLKFLNSWGWDLSTLYQPHMISPLWKETAVRCGYVLEEAEIILGGILTNLEFELDTLFGLGLLRTCSGLKIFSPKKIFRCIAQVATYRLGQFPITPLGFGHPASRRLDFDLADGGCGFLRQNPRPWGEHPRGRGNSWWWDHWTWRILRIFVWEELRFFPWPGKCAGGHAMTISWVLC